MNFLFLDRQMFSALKKKILLLLLVTVLLAGCSTKDSTSEEQSKTDTNAKNIELTLANFFPSTHPVNTDLFQPWAKEIEESTNGQVKITVYPGQTLLNAPDTYDGVVNGIADIGLAVPSYTLGRFPTIEVFEVPGITYNNSKVSSKVQMDTIQKLNPKEIQDTKLLMLFGSGPGHFFTKTPIRSANDLKGMEIRAGGSVTKTLQALGANPISMTQNEAYDALAKGMVKGNLAPFETLKANRLAEVTDYITMTKYLYNASFLLAMNLDKWNSLTPDLQQTIDKVTAKYFEEVAIGLWDKMNEAALKYAIDEEGMKIVEMPEEEHQKFIKLVEPLQDNYVKYMKEKGLNGQEVLDTVKAVADKYNKQYN